MLRPQKGNSGVSFNDTLLNFGLWALFICPLLAVLILASKSSLEQDSVESQLTRSFNLNTFSSVSLIISEENLVFFLDSWIFFFKNPFWNVILWYYAYSDSRQIHLLVLKTGWARLCFLKHNFIQVNNPFKAFPLSRVIWIIVWWITGLAWIICAWTLYFLGNR